MHDIFRTMQPYRNILTICILFAVTLGLYSLRWFHGLQGGDYVTAAERVLSGQIPYRDFWTMYAPGSFYLLALLYKIFGTHILVGSIAASVICSGAVCLCYRLAVNLTGRETAGVLCAGIFFAASYATSYCITPGPYPMTILLVLTALNLFIRHTRSGSATLLFAAGIATGTTIIFKHDVGGYTGLAIAAGLITGQLLQTAVTHKPVLQLARTLAVFSAGAALPAVPVAACFAVLAGPDMWQDLIVFPATDFRFARPENYPGLWPTGIYHEWLLKMLFNILDYLTFTVPFAVFLCAVAALAVAAARRHLACLVPGVTFAAGFLLHYSSAHIQINTNIISMSLYASLLGALLYMLISRTTGLGRAAWFNAAVVLLATGWMLALLVKPLYNLYSAYHLTDQAAAELTLPKMSGIRVSPAEQRELQELYEFINATIPPGKKTFIGQHRHDAVVVGDTLTYFALDRLNATRHDQLHPGIVDREVTQREIIRDLESGNIDIILTKVIFGDAILDRARQRRALHLKDTGATVLDRYIRENYREIRTIGQYTVWQRTTGKQNPGPSAASRLQPDH